MQSEVANKDCPVVNAGHLIFYTHTHKFCSVEWDAMAVSMGAELFSWKTEMEHQVWIWQETTDLLTLKVNCQY